MSSHSCTKFSSKFFEALGQSGDEAIALLRDTAFENGIDQEPSQRAADLIKTGEWDSKPLVSLSC
jgi:hypothetical protein